MNYNILIISLEGIESNTEIIFFNGLLYHFPHVKGKAKAIGKLGVGTKALNQFSGRWKLLLREIIDNIPNKKMYFLLVAETIKLIFLQWNVQKNLLQEKWKNMVLLFTKSLFMIKGFQ